jgi:ADP-heptose:LPS heptosyltransferase
MEHGLALAAPWIRGLGFYAPTAVEDLRPDVLDHAYLGPSWGRSRIAGQALDRVWQSLREGGVLCCSAEEAAFSRKRFGDWLFGQPNWLGLDDVHAIPTVPGSWFAAIQKTADGGQIYRPLSREKLDLLVVRSGGHGDGLLAGMVATRVREIEPDCHITYFTTQAAGEVLIGHPHIDRLLIFQQHRYADPHFQDVYDVWKARFQRTLYLNETFETLLLPNVQNAWYSWPKGAREKIADYNYEEFLCLATGIPFKAGCVRFYGPEVESPDGGPNIAWCLAGSTNHKVLPFSGSAITRILNTHPDAHVHLLGGGERDRNLARMVTTQVKSFLGNASRVHDRTDQPLRDNCSFAQLCDLVVGPETGLLWAVAYEDVRKIVVLSHSTVENLTKHWTNCDALWPTDCALYPCHQLHFDGNECPVNEHGVAQCAAAIDVELLLQKVNHGLQASQRVLVPARTRLHSVGE